jgi:hypothetical protein
VTSRNLAAARASDGFVAAVFLGLDPKVFGV